jgi:predicted XRE-type DNA-binding protein
MSNPRIGGSFDEFLGDEGIREEVEDLAQKRVIAWQIEQAMKKSGINKVEMAERMGTSRTQVDRLLDPNNNKVQLDTLQRAAHAVGRTLKLELLEPTRKSA